MSRSNCLSGAIAPADGYTAVLKKIKAGQKRLKITRHCGAASGSGVLEMHGRRVRDVEARATESSRRI
jgi:hypothetical protein